MPPTAWQTREFVANVHRKAQESRAKIDGTTRLKRGNGKFIGWPTIDPAEGQSDNRRFAPTPNNTPNRQMRWVQPTKWDVNLMDDDIDELENFWQIESDHVMLAASSRNRERTRRFIRASLGGALESLEDDPGTPFSVIPLPATQLVPHGAAGTTRNKLAVARSMLDQAVGGDVEMWGPYYHLYDPFDLQTLVTEADFNTIDSVRQQQLMTGMPIQGLFGFNWIPTAQLPVDTATGIRTNICWARMAMGCGENQENFVRSGERSDLSYAHQIYQRMKMGYVRIDDKGVIRLEVDTANLQP